MKYALRQITAALQKSQGSIKSEAVIIVIVTEGYISTMYINTPGTLRVILCSSPFKTFLTPYRKTYFYIIDL